MGLSLKTTSYESSLGERDYELKENQIDVCEIRERGWKRGVGEAILFYVVILLLGRTHMF